MATEDLPQPLTEAIHAAVDAWSEFVMAGDPAVLGSSFVADGPQGRQFEAESAAWKERPGSEPLRLEIHKSRLRYLDSTAATVWVRVEASRSGFVSEVFGWDFDLIHQKERVLNTLVELAQATLSLDQRLTHIRDESDKDAQLEGWDEVRRAAFTTAFVLLELDHAIR